MIERFIKKNTTYVVPFFDIPYGSKIVIYGGGKLGENYYRKIKSGNYAEIVAIIDSQAKTLPKIFGDIPVYEPNKICELHFHFILIAVEDIDNANDIKQFLSSSNIPENKIIWKNEKECFNEKAMYEIIKCCERNMEDVNRRFFLFMLPEHGNLGDYVIGYAELSFFKCFFNKYSVYGITSSEWLAASEFYKSLIKPNDIIFINGGGFFGDLRGDAEIYRFIVESFPQNKKIFFPNTLTYQEKPSKENKNFMKDIEWFKKQENLFIFFREYPSYHIFEQYDKRCCLFPDMAFYLHYERNKFCRKNKVLLCLRSDCEKVFSEKEKLENKLKYAGIDYALYDINTGRYISQQAGHELLKYTIKLFQSYDCIITDRLHGMILATISNVPCIAFDNLTHKISGVFEFIKDLQYIKLIAENQIANISEIISIVYQNKLKGESYRPPMEEYEKMATKIYEIMASEV